MIVSSLHTQHPRRFEENRFVYPVLSRRSAGISVGVNLNPDKVCNFDCIYCQVDRTTQSETRFVEFAQLLEELEVTLRLVASGELFDAAVPALPRAFFSAPASDEAKSTSRALYPGVSALAIFDDSSSCR